MKSADPSPNPKRFAMNPPTSNNLLRRTIRDKNATPKYDDMDLSTGPSIGNSI